MKIVVVDVDGVLIPATQVLINVASCVHRIFPATTIAVLNELCKLSGALIVFNTSHNSPHQYGPTEDIKESVIKAGIKERFIHPTDHKTNFKNQAWTKMPLSRDQGPIEWVSRHPEVTDWVVLDDVVCADDDHMILVDPNAGLHLGHLNQALRMFNCGTELFMF